MGERRDFVSQDDLPKPLPPGTPSTPPGAHSVHPGDQRRQAETLVGPGGDAFAPDPALFARRGQEELPKPVAPAPPAVREDAFDTIVADPPQQLIRASRPPRPSRASRSVPARPAARPTRPRPVASSSSVASFPLRPNAPRASVAKSKVTSTYQRQRRRGPDIIGLIPPIAAVFAWFGFGVAAVFFDRAHPSSYGLDRLFGVRRSLLVDAGALEVAHAMVWVTVFLCVVGLGFNSRRMRRQGDRYNRSLIFLGILSSAILLAGALLSTQ